MRHTHTISATALREVCPSLSVARSRELAKDLGTALVRFEPGIGSFAAAYFIAQCAHESGEFRFSREIWGPTAVQSGYWRRRELQGPGLLFPALSKRYRGGGWIQTTGRAHFRTAARRLKVRSALWLSRHAHQDDFASLMAALWWADHFPANMSGARFTTESVTRTVNGGTNGLDERRKYTARAMKVRKSLKPRRLP